MIDYRKEAEELYKEIIGEIKYKPMVYKSTVEDKPIAYYKSVGDFEILSKGQILDRKFAIISRHGGSYPAAYVSVKEIEKSISTHYEVDYDIDVHGGDIDITRAYWDKSDGDYYIGWDYRDYGDFRGNDFYHKDNEKKWTTEEIIKDVIYVILQLNDCEWVDVSEPKYAYRLKSE